MSKRPKAQRKINHEYIRHKYLWHKFSLIPGAQDNRIKFRIAYVVYCMSYVEVVCDVIVLLINQKDYELFLRTIY